jgi:hypothetical protein
MEAIIRLRREAIGAGLTATGGARHVTGFAQIIEREGRLNETAMPLKVVGFSVKRMLGVMPLGIRMFLKGKTPNPFGHPMTGIAQVRHIFNAFRRPKPV